MNVTIKQTSYIWLGRQVLARAKTAMAVGLSRLTARGAEISKTLVDVDTGALQESIHSAPLNHIEEIGDGLDVGSTSFENVTADDVSWQEYVALAEFGSWLDYACVEEVTGTSFVAPAADMLVGTEADMAFVGAFKEAGL